MIYGRYYAVEEQLIQPNLINFVGISIFAMIGVFITTIAAPSWIWRLILLVKNVFGTICGKMEVQYLCLNMDNYSGYELLGHHHYSLR